MGVTGLGLRFPDVVPTGDMVGTWEEIIPGGGGGPPGPPGPQGVPGPQGPAGPGVPTGGTAGQVLEKISDTDYATAWLTPSSSLPPSGAAGGDLTGSYPNPELRALAVGTPELADGAVTDAKIVGVAYAKVTGAPTALPPSGAASGDLTGTYPGPAVAAGAITRAKTAPDCWLPPIPADPLNVGHVLTVTGGPTLAWSTVPSGSTTGPYEYMFSTTTTEPPTGSEVRLNTAVQNTATKVWVKDVGADGVDHRNYLLITKPGQGIYLQDKDDSSKYQFYRVTGDPVGKTGYVEFPVVWEKGGADLVPQRILVSGTAASGGYATATPIGPAGGELAGSYPNPTLAITGVAPAIYGDATHVPVLDVRANGRIYGCAPTAIAFPTPVVSVGPTAPASPQQGQLWWRNDPDGNLYVYYNDGTSSQFVPATSLLNAAPSGPAGGDLAGSFFPNPVIAAGAITGSKIAVGSLMPAIPRIALNTGFLLGPWSPATFTLNVPFKSDIAVTIMASCYATTVSMTGLCATIDGVDMSTWLDLFFNQTGIHTNVGTSVMLRNVAAGNHTIGLRHLSGNVTSDANDRAHFTFQMIEVP